MAEFESRNRGPFHNLSVYIRDQSQGSICESGFLSKSLAKHLHRFRWKKTGLKSGQIYDPETTICMGLKMVGLSLDNHNSNPYALSSVFVKLLCKAKFEEFQITRIKLYPYPYLLIYGL